MQGQGFMRGRTAVFGAAVVWTNKLAVDGTIAVVSLSPVPPPQVKVTGTGANSVTLGGVGAGAYEGYGIFSSTLVTTPMANWSLIGGATANGSGVIQFTDTHATPPQKYYRFGQ